MEPAPPNFRPAHHPGPAAAPGFSGEFHGAVNAGNTAVNGPVNGVGVAVGHGNTVTVNLYQGLAYPRPNYRFDSAGLVKFYQAAFVGREPECQQIATLAAQEVPGYWLIEAPPGYGKSALIANLVARHQQGQWEHPRLPQLLYFFIRAEGQRNTPIAFLQALNAQLLDWLQVAGGVPAELTLLQNQLSQLWAGAVWKAQSTPQPLLLLVDGLDEMALGETTIAQFLPAPLGPLVHIVVTSRPNPEPLQQVALEHPLRQAGFMRLATLTAQDVDRLMAYHETARRFAPEIWALTKGEPLFVRFVGEDVVAGGEAALRRLQHTPPANVEEYFQQQFKLLKKQADAGDELTWDVLGVLLVTLGAINAKELAEVLDVPLRKINRAIERIRRFLLGAERVELMHLQLRKVLEKQGFASPEWVAYQGKILAWCRGYQAQNWPRATPEYVVRHYGAHLQQAHAPAPGFYALLCESWLRAWERLDGTPDGFLTDAQRAWTQAEEEGPTALGQMVRAALCFSSVASLSANIDDELMVACLKAGVFKPALARMMARKKIKPKDRAISLARISIFFPSEEQYKLLAEALTAIHAIQDHWQMTETLYFVAAYLPPQATDLLAEALTTASMIQKEDYRATALTAVIERLSVESENLLGDALVAAWKFHDERWRTIVLQAVAARLSFKSEDLLAKALAAAHTLLDTACRAEALSVVSAHLPLEARLKVLAEAIAAACATREEIYRTDALCTVIKHLPPSAANLRAEALAAAQTLQDETYRAMVLEAMTEEVTAKSVNPLNVPDIQLNKSGGATPKNTTDTQLMPEEEPPAVLRKALAVVRTLQDAGSRAYIFCALAEYLPPEEQPEILDEALVIARMLQDGYILCVVAEHLAPHQRIEILTEAVSIAANQEEWRRVEVLCKVVTQLPPEAVDLFIAVFNSTHEMHEVERTDVLCAIAKHLPPDATNLQNIVIVAAHALQDKKYCAQVLSAIAEQLALEERLAILAEALTIVRTIPNDWSRAFTLNAVTEHLFPEATNLLAEALVAACTITDSRYRAEALCAVAEHLPEPERSMRLTEALTVARTIVDDHAWVHTLSLIAKFQPEEERSTLLTEALERARAMQHNTGTYAFALCAVTKYLPANALNLRLDILRLLPKLSHEPQSAKILKALAPHWAVMCQEGGLSEFKEVVALLRVYTSTKRENLLGALEALLPILSRLGGKRAVRETAQAIIDTAKWWP